jgi:hypothetical protein
MVCLRNICVNTLHKEIVAMMMMMMMMIIIREQPGRKSM